MQKRNLFISISLILCLILILSAPLTAEQTNKAPMRVVTYDLHLLFQLGIMNESGQLLVWTGKIKGHINGYAAWWFDMPFQDPLIHDDFVVDFYSGRWEVYDSDPYPTDGLGGVVFNPDANLLLAGLSAGETLYPTDPADSDGIWDGDGIVTETCNVYRAWRGCVMHESGPVVMSNPSEGDGKIRIYPKGFRPRDLLNNPELEAPKQKTRPEEFGLLKNYPNPFNPSTRIVFNLSESAQVHIEVFDNTGQKITTLIDAQMQAGNHKVEWDASEMASGIYYYKITAYGIPSTKRTILVK